MKQLISRLQRTSYTPRNIITTPYARRLNGGTPVSSSSNAFSEGPLADIPLMPIHSMDSISKLDSMDSLNFEVKHALFCV